MTIPRLDADAGTGPLHVALEDLCETLLAGPHRQAREDVDRLREIAAAMPGGPDGGAERVALAVDALARLLESHAAKEEHILFPAVRALAEADRMGQPRPSLPFPTLLHPIRLLETEHARLGQALEVLDAAVNASGSGAWTGWPILRHAADALADAIASQIRIESLALFPRALDLDRRL